MKLSSFIFHVDSRKCEMFKDIVADFFKHSYPSAQKKGSLTLTNDYLVVSTYDFDWKWCQVSSFVDSVLRIAEEKNILVVCESVNF